MKLETGNNASIITLKGITPEIQPGGFFCEGVRIIGDVKIGKDVSVWYNSVIRGDVHYIRIGDRCNIQDLCLLHVTNGRFPLNIGNDVSIGHAARVHGCTLKDKCLIGIGAIVLDGAIIGENALVAAGSVVKEGFEVPSGTLAAGVPAKIIRELTSDEKEAVANTAANYMKYADNYRRELTMNK
ncbi:MAG: gamma carbonic anhydrase family protein [Bacteroidota bacterium]